MQTAARQIKSTCRTYLNKTIPGEQVSMVKKTGAFLQFAERIDSLFLKQTRSVSPGKIPPKDRQRLYTVQTKPAVQSRFDDSDFCAKRFLLISLLFNPIRP